MPITLIFALSLCWDPSPEPNVSQYRLYRDGVFAVSTPLTRATIPDLESNRVYSITATAVDTNGVESEHSAPLEYVIPHLKITQTPLEVTFPVPLHKANVDYILESTADFIEWRTETYVEENRVAKHMIIPEEKRFFRVKLTVRAEGCSAQ